MGEERELGRRYFASIELDLFVLHIEQKGVFFGKVRKAERKRRPTDAALQTRLRATSQGPAYGSYPRFI